MHCLVVDDSEVIRKVARSILESLGHDVTTAEGGHKAIAACLARMPDLVLVDWQMPGMNGLEFLGALRLASRGPRPYIVYCLTENDPSEIERAILGGAHDVLLKPFDRVVLSEKLARIAAGGARAARAGAGLVEGQPLTA